MIRISRQQLDQNARRIEPDADWYELAREATDQAIANRTADPVQEHIYRADIVKKALEKLFHRKCAYCETELARIEWEVEHYRPKGTVHGEQHPGYYWLTYRWENLFPACKYCNQRRRDPGTWDDETREGAGGGKGTHFPIAGVRATDPEGDLPLEQPLLLNPCEDDPEDFLVYLANGDVQAVAESPRGEASIRLYHLDMTRLREAREQRIQEVLRFVQLIRLFEAQGKMEAAAELDVVLRENYCADHSTYAAVGRAVLRDPEIFGFMGPAAP